MIGVSNQVEHDLPDLSRIAIVVGLNCATTCKDQLQSLLHSRWSHEVDDPLAAVPVLRSSPRQARSARTRPWNSRNTLFRMPSKASPGPAAISRLRRWVALKFCFLEQPQHPQHARHWRTDFVAHRRQELRLRATGALCPIAGLVMSSDLIFELHGPFRDQFTQVPRDADEAPHSYVHAQSQALDVS